MSPHQTDRCGKAALTPPGGLATYRDNLFQPVDDSRYAVLDQGDV
jgi:hypothetical protein